MSESILERLQWKTLCEASIALARPMSMLLDMAQRGVVETKRTGETLVLYRVTPELVAKLNPSGNSRS